MKHVFEVLEPPPHGLTRLRAAMDERKKQRLLWPVLVSAVAAAVVVVVNVGRPPNALASEFEARARAGESVTARGASAVEALPSGSPEVVIYRVTSW
ncbi:MAG: hypothetical protein DI536_24055 [Archangium gephyra]|uniref:Uncharacterized protein n=1 Tax=Archangium gephyra TaxID=48 RepID=A0A2W5TB10_9BACT|nr:MAG: hypothetical protein DI536_24055 [Archangium gephyra]